MVNTGGTAKHPVKTAGLKAYWAHGVGAAKIRWGTPGDFNRCVIEVNKSIVKSGQKPLPDGEIKGLCSNLHLEATGKRPGHAPGESTGSKVKSAAKRMFKRPPDK